MFRSWDRDKGCWQRHTHVAVTTSDGGGEDITSIFVVVDLIFEWLTFTLALARLDYFSHSSEPDVQPSAVLELDSADSTLGGLVEKDDHGIDVATATTTTTTTVEVYDDGNESIGNSWSFTGNALCSLHTRSTIVQSSTTLITRQSSVELKAKLSS